MLQEVTLKCKQLADTNQEVEARCGGLELSLAGKDKTCEAQQQLLAEAAKAERTRSVWHRTRVSE
jgi:hypothetical protein